MTHLLGFPAIRSPFVKPPIVPVSCPGRSAVRVHGPASVQGKKRCSETLESFHRNGLFAWTHNDGDALAHIFAPSPNETVHLPGASAGELVLLEPTCKARFTPPGQVERLDTYHVPPIGMGKGLSHEVYGSRLAALAWRGSFRKECTLPTTIRA
jgi:hypothetical protein